MSTNKEVRYPTKKGPPSIRSRKLHFFDDDNNDGARLPANLLAMCLEKNMGPIISGGICPDLSTTLVVPGFTATTGGTGDATAYSTAGGLLITCPSDDDFNMDFASVLSVTPASGKWYSMMARIQVSDATGIGFRLGLGNAQALPFTTDYTDFIGISKAIASANVLGRVRGNSGTAADSATLGAIVAATEIEVGFCAYVHATAPQGFFYYKTAAGEAPTLTAFTAAQKTAVSDILTTPPACFWTIHATGVTLTTPTMTVSTFLAGGDR